LNNGFIVLNGYHINMNFHISTSLYPDLDQDQDFFIFLYPFLVFEFIYQNII